MKVLNQDEKEKKRKNKRRRRKSTTLYSLLMRPGIGEFAATEDCVTKWLQIDVLHAQPSSNQGTGKQTKNITGPRAWIEEGREGDHVIARVIERHLVWEKKSPAQPANLLSSRSWHQRSCR